jgi:hypothetical protein
MVRAYMCDNEEWQLASGLPLCRICCLFYLFSLRFSSLEIAFDQQEADNQGEVYFDGTSLPELYDSSEEDEEGSGNVSRQLFTDNNRQIKPALFLLEFWKMIIALVFWHNWNNSRTANNSKTITATPHNNDSDNNTETIQTDTAGAVKG